MSHKTFISSEWGTLKQAIVHNGENSIDIHDQAILISETELAKHPEQGPVSRKGLTSQHSVLIDFLSRSGVELLSPPTCPDAFCQVFCRDPAFVIGDTIFMARMRDEYRKSEGIAVKRLTEHFNKRIALDRGTIEGGDVFVLNQHQVLVGIGDVTDISGVTGLADALSRSQIEMVSVRHEALHLDCCVAPLPDGSGLISDSRLPVESVKILEQIFSKLIPVDDCEALLSLSTNLFWMSPELVLSTNAVPKTNSLLRFLGFKVQSFDYDEVVHLWGSIRCAICPILREESIGLSG